MVNLTMKVKLGRLLWDRGSIIYQIISFIFSILFSIWVSDVSCYEELILILALALACSFLSQSVAFDLLITLFYLLLTMLL